MYYIRNTVTLIEMFSFEIRVPIVGFIIAELINQKIKKYIYLTFDVTIIYALLIYQSFL